MTKIVGWDLGGANIKTALVEQGRVYSVAQFPCPVIQDRSKFDVAVRQALEACPDPAGLHAVTMTGELSDVFADRAQGVAYLVNLMREVLQGHTVLIYGGRAGFIEPRDAAAHSHDIASANWHASAAYAAKHRGEGLLIDIGTTTSDLIPFRAGTVASRGYSDGERLAEGELIYAGVVRTPIAAIVREAAFKGRTQRIAAERFATMADVYRLTGELPGDADLTTTADQRGKSVGESAARLARMLGRDAADADETEWRAVAQQIADAQLADLEAAARRLIARERLDAGAPLIGAGCGRFLVRRLAARLARRYIDFAELLDVAEPARAMAANCAPAVAVALLVAATPSTSRKE